MYFVLIKLRSMWISNLNNFITNKGSLIEVQGRILRGGANHSSGSLKQGV